MTGSLHSENVDVGKGRRMYILDLAEVIRWEAERRSDTEEEKKAIIKVLESRLVTRFDLSPRPAIQH